MTPARSGSVLSSNSAAAFAEAAAAAAGADVARRAACGAALLKDSPSSWRDESLRLLLARALADGDEGEADRLAGALPTALVFEERLTSLALRDPVSALAAAAGLSLPARAWQRLLWTGAAMLHDAAVPTTRDLLAAALCAALGHLPPAVAFLEAVGLARCFAEDANVDIFHLMVLGATPGLAAGARVDLLLAVGAALAARGATVEASMANAEAALLAGESR